MFAGLLAYPFVLLRARPLSVGGALVLIVVAYMAMDLAFAASGLDPYDDPSGDGRRVYLLANSIGAVLTFVVGAVIMGVALTQLRCREAGWSWFADIARSIVIWLKFTLAVIVPLAGTAWFIGLKYMTDFVSLVDPIEPYAPYVYYAVLIPWVLAYIYLGTRFSLAAPAALAEGRWTLWRGWVLSRRRFWALFGLTLVANLMAYVPNATISYLIEEARVFATDGEAVVTLDAGLQPGSLATSAMYAVMNAYLTLVLSAAPAFLYSALNPVETDTTAVAEVF